MERKEQILNILQANQALDAGQITEKLQAAGMKASKATLNRDLINLENGGLILVTGKGKATRYNISSSAGLFLPINVEEYIEKGARNRAVTFNRDIFDLLKAGGVLDVKEKAYLHKLRSAYLEKIKGLQEGILKREMERLTIELSWKSSAIEGNTYDLLETEALLKEGVEAKGKPKEDAIMLLNHKYTLEFILKNKNQFEQASVDGIQLVHEILIKDLNIGKGIRNSPVGISGTNYEPLAERGTLMSALTSTCELINSKEDIYEKALIALLLIAYIQPFVDGNKRTSRMFSNAVLIAGNTFPLSYRSVSITDYKKALIVFYEINNLLPFKNLFIQQCEASAKDYFHVELPEKS